MQSDQRRDREGTRQHSIMAMPGPPGLYGQRTKAKELPEILTRWGAACCALTTTRCVPRRTETVQRRSDRVKSTGLKTRRYNGRYKNHNQLENPLRKPRRKLNARTSA